MAAVWNIVLAILALRLNKDYLYLAQVVVSWDALLSDFQRKTTIRPRHQSRGMLVVERTR
jgi:homospermidine synthase